jgi:hypothetical protein
MDLRIPSGFFFASIGAILLVVGIVQPGLRAPLTQTNANLYTGAAILAFGGILLWLARRRSS